MKTFIFIAGIGLLLLGVALAWLSLASRECTFEVRDRMAGFGGDKATTVMGVLPDRSVRYVERRDAAEVRGERWEVR